MQGQAAQSVGTFPNLPAPMLSFQAPRIPSMLVLTEHVGKLWVWGLVSSEASDFQQCVFN